MGQTAMVSMNRSMVAVAALALLGGCGWFDSSSPTTSEKARPGAERQVTATNALPGAGAGHSYDGAVAPVDETRSAPKIGSVVAGKGGQKAQLEAATKEANEREAKAREERLRRGAGAVEYVGRGARPPDRALDDVGGDVVGAAGAALRLRRRRRRDRRGRR